MPGSKIIIVILLLIPWLAFAQPDTGEYKGLLNVNYLDERDTLIENIWIDSAHENFSLFVDFRHKKVRFLKNINGRQMQCGTYAIEDKWLMQCLRFEDLNADGVYETMLGSTPNMNGNKWFNIFIYDKKGDSIALAGNINTNYTIDSIHKSIQVDYEGSWYMEAYRELYKWHGYRLIPEKMAIKLPDAKNGRQGHIEYYTNPTHTLNGLKRISRQLINDNNKKQKALWENFFMQP